MVGFDHLTVRQLRSRCSERGLSANGTKGQLRKRLRDDQRASFCAASLPDPSPPPSSPPIPSIEKVCRQRGLLELDIDKNAFIQRALSLEECSTQRRTISSTFSVVPTRPRGIHQAWFRRIQPSEPPQEECSEPEGTFSSAPSHPDPTSLPFSLLHDRHTLASLSNGDLDAIVNHCLHPPTPVGPSEELINDQHEKRSIDARTKRQERDAAGDLDAFEIYKQEVAAIKKSLRRELDVFQAEKRVLFLERMGKLSVASQELERRKVAEKKDRPPTFMEELGFSDDEE